MPAAATSAATNSQSGLPALPGFIGKFERIWIVQRWREHFPFQQKFHGRGRHWDGGGDALLGFSAPFPPWGRGFRMGTARGAGRAIRTESLCEYPAGNSSLPAASGIAGVAVRAVSCRTGGGAVFWAQFGAARARAGPRRSEAVADFSGVPVLGRSDDRAVDAASDVCGVFSGCVCILFSQAANRSARRPDSCFPRRSALSICCFAGEF